MSKHTPAPWEWTRERHADMGYSGLWNAQTRQEVFVSGGRNDGDYPITWIGEDMSDADKALISAAPDLLEALKAYREALIMGPLDIAAKFGPDVSPGELLLRADLKATAAIAKASAQ